jgi:acetyl esterase/lipase
MAVKWGVVVALCASVLFVPSAVAGAAEPSLALATSRAQGDGALVMLHGTGFDPGQWVFMNQCRADTDTWDECDRRELDFEVVTDANGGFAMHVALDQVIQTWAGDEVDCAVERCVLRTSEGVSTPITMVASPPPTVRYRDRVFTDVDEDLNKRYGTAIDWHGNAVDLFIDVFEPADDDSTALRPAVIWMHGGYFEFGDRTTLWHFARDLAQRGYVTASISYRLRPGKDRTDVIGEAQAAHDAMVDAGAAIRWFKDHADEYRVDTRAIAFGGYSAGAVTALNLSAAADELEGDASIAAAISLAGRRLFGGSPLPGEPPALVIHGERDDVVLHEFGLKDCNEIRAVGNGCTMLTLTGVNHIIRIPYERAFMNRTASFLRTKVLRPLGIR